MRAVDWNAYAEHYDVLNALNPYRELTRTVAREALVDGAETVLDAGCGTGNLLRRLRVQGAAELVGMDGSSAMLARSRKKSPEAACIQADLNQPLPVPDESFDAVTCVNTLYAVADPRMLLAQCARVLRTGGRLVLATPRAGYENGLILKAHCKSSKPDTHWQHAHANPEREEQLIREAFGNDETTVHGMLTVAAINRQIAKESHYHFFEAHELCALLYESGLTLEHYTSAYAQQSHLIVATR